DSLHDFLESKPIFVLIAGINFRLPAPLKLDLFVRKGVPVLDFKRQKISVQVNCPVFDVVNDLEASLRSSSSPYNQFEEWLQWTVEGKMWRFPIDNEQDQELKLIGEYGLRNKREVWRVKYVLAKIRKSARELLTLDEKDPRRLFGGSALLRRLVRVGVLPEDKMKLDFVLGLKIEDFLERRLQTQVFKLGLAVSIHHARVLIRQRHIRVRTQMVNCPGFMVRLDSGKLIDFTLSSPLGKGGPDWEEKHVSFADHTFLDKHVDPELLKCGPIASFMELVCQGLAQNPNFTVEQKRQHLKWYAAYFKGKTQIVEASVREELRLAELEKRARGSSQSDTHGT
ncbi:hypothetical protein EG68_12248, partial [Paragonimus skrjabini miyazakii]